MKITMIAAALLAAATLSAQPTLTGVTLRSQVGVTNQFSAQKTPQTSTCASAPYTADSQIYTVAVVVEPQIAGFAPSPSVGHAGALVSSSNPNLVYFIVGDPGISQIKTSRKSYPSAFAASAGAIVVPDLSWADAADILASLQASADMVSGLRNSVATHGSLSVVPVTLSGIDMDDLVIALGNKGVRNLTATGWSQGVQLIQSGQIAGATAGTTVPLSIPTNPGAIQTSFDQAPRDLQAQINGRGIAATARSSTSQPGSASALNEAIFIVDSPCLTVELLPSVGGTNVAGGELQFNGHYLLPFAKGNSFARVEAHGASPINQTGNGSLNTFGSIFDLAINRDMNSTTVTAPVRFTAGLTASYDRTNANGGGHGSKGSGGLKGSVSFPNLGLAGNDTRPTLTFEAVGSSINGTTADSSQFEGTARFKAKFRWTPILNSAVDAKYLYSNDPIYGTGDHNRKSNYLINVDLMKFTVRDPIEFAVTWKCGRTVPDYQRVCGFFTGLSLTSNQ